MCLGLKRKCTFRFFARMQKFRNISLDLTIRHKVSFLWKFFSRSRTHLLKVHRVLRKLSQFFLQTPVNFPVITKMVTSFHILPTNFPFCNNPEENLKFVNFASNFRENAKTKMFVSTLWFLLYANKFFAIQLQLALLAGVLVQFLANLW